MTSLVACLGHLLLEHSNAFAVYTKDLKELMPEYLCFGIFGRFILPPIGEGCSAGTNFGE